MMPPGCVSPPTRKVSTVRCPMARCLRVNPGRKSVFHSSKSGWMRVALHKQVVRLGDFSAEAGETVRACARMPTHAVRLHEWRRDSSSVHPTLRKSAQDGAAELLWLP